MADAWERLPVRTAGVDVVLSVFAPRQPAELSRVLVRGGHAVVVSPLPEHLAGLREAWGLLDVEPGKQERLAATFAEHLEPVGATDVRRSVAVSGPDLDDLVAMGPNAFHQGVEHPAGAPGTIELAVRVSTWRQPR